MRLKFTHLQQYSLQFFHLAFRCKFFSCRGAFDWIFIDVDPILEMQKSAPSFEKSRFSNTLSLQNYRLHLFNRDFNRKLQDCGVLINLKIVDFVPCIKILIVRKFQKVSMIKLIFHLKYSLDSFHQVLNRKFHIYGGAFIWRIMCIHPWFVIFIVLFFRNVLLIMLLPETQFVIFPDLRDQNLSSKSQSEIFLLESFQLKNYTFRFFGATKICVLRYLIHSVKISIT